MITKQKNGDIFIPHKDVEKLRRIGILDPVGFIGKMFVGFVDNIDSEVKRINKQLNLI